MTSTVRPVQDGADQRGSHVSGRDARDGARDGGRDAARYCGWCGRRLPDADRVGRPRRYCGQACRQRAYERRTAAQRTGIPEDAVVLSAAEVADLQDRVFQMRCAAEDVRTAADEDADPAELRGLAARLVDTVRDLERLR